MLLSKLEHFTLLDKLFKYHMDPDKSDAIITVLSDVLTTLCRTNDEQDQSGPLNKFYASDVPGISIREYLTRIKRYARCSNPCFILSLIYIDRLIQGGQNFILCSLNVHRVLITTVMLAAKYFDDNYFCNKYYARVGGVESNEINGLELEFLFMTNFSLAVERGTFINYYEQLMQHMQQLLSAEEYHLAMKQREVVLLQLQSPDGIGHSVGRSHGGNELPAPTITPPDVPTVATADIAATTPVTAAAAVASTTSQQPQQPIDQQQYQQAQYQQQYPQQPYQQNSSQVQYQQQFPQQQQQQPIQTYQPGYTQYYPNDFQAPPPQQQQQQQRQH